MKTLQVIFHKDPYDGEKAKGAGRMLSTKIIFYLKHILVLGIWSDPRD